MPSSVLPHAPSDRSANGATTSPPVPDRADRPVRSPLLARLTSLTSIASVAAAGMMAIGVLALIGGHYDKQVVHDQLAPQKIFFPAAGSAALLPGVKQYAGQQLLTGGQAKAYANNFIGVHVTKIAGGLTYAQVATKSSAAPNDAALTAQKAALFQGETLRGLLLSAWGWSVVGTIATLAGLLLLVLGAALLLLPLANWQVNLRHRAAVTA